MNITQDLLQRFIGTEHEPREFMRKPWSVNGHIYATNGHYGIRLDAAPEGVEALPITDKHPDIEKLFVAADAIEREWQSVPQLPAIKPCELCDGSGKVTTAACGDCYGDGYFFHGVHEYECKNCEGDGEIYCQGGDLHTCPDCDGHGEQISRSRDSAIGIGNAHASVVYLRVISQLPAVRIASGKTPTDSILFTFEGGRGILMPMRL